MHAITGADVGEICSEAVLESPNLLVPQLTPSKSDYQKADQDHPDEQQPPKVKCHVHIWW